METLKTTFAKQKLRAFLDERDWSYARLAYELSKVLEREKPLTAAAVAYWLNDSNTRPDTAIVIGLANLTNSTVEDWYE